jgi:hypothetical protein
MQANKRMPKRKSQLDFSYPADLVWAADCTAHRVNAGYLKAPEINDQGKITRPTNRELVKLYLVDDSHQFVTDSDYQQGRKCRQDLINSVTMAALKGQLTEWNMLTARMVELDIVTTDYEVSVITAMPKSYDQTVHRENTDSRLAHCDSEPVGSINERIELAGEVVRCNYSKQYNTHYVTVITNTNQQVFFAYRERLEPGREIAICGRVKRHADRATQLSRVKLVKQEGV